MTVSATENRKEHAGNGKTTSFATPVFFNDGDVVVYLVNDTTGDSTEWTRNTQFTLSGAGNASGGTLTVETAPTDYTPASGETLVIITDPTIDQGVDLVNNDALDAEVLEQALDELTVMIQRVNSKNSRALRFSDDAVAGGASTDLPLPEASRALVWNAGGDALENGPETDEISNAQTYANSALSYLEDFKSRWLGAQASDPTVDLNGDPISAGAAYFNTVSNAVRTYDGNAWSTFTELKQYERTLTAGQTDITGLSYSLGSTLVFINGVLLQAEDYTDTDGSTITLAVAANNGDAFRLLAAGDFDITPTASNITFDNSNSGLSATQVQGAIDELSAVEQSSSTVNATITPGIDGKIVLTAGQNTSEVRVLETGSWTQGWPVECDDANREFTLINNSGFTATVTTSGTTPTTYDVPSDGTPYPLQSRAGVGVELALPDTVEKGAIVESDSNASGDYTRWENGDQLAIVPITLDLTTNNIQSFSSPADFAVGTLKSGCVSYETVAVGDISASGSASLRFDDSNGVGFSTRCDGTGSDTAVSARVLIWGKWK